MANATQSQVIQLGNLSMSLGVQALLQQGRLDPYEYLCRHSTGDWGEISEAAWRANDAARRNADRVHSAYQLTPDVTLWIITEGDPRVTTLSLASEH